MLKHLKEYIDFSNYDIEETNRYKIPHERDRDKYRKYIGRRVIISDDSKYSRQNPTDSNGNKIQGVIRYINRYHLPFVVEWNGGRYFNSYDSYDLLLVQ